MAASLEIGEAQASDMGDAVRIEGLDKDGPCSFAITLEPDQYRNLKSNGHTDVLLPANCPIVRLVTTELAKQHNLGPDGVWDGTLREEKIEVSRFLAYDGSVFREDESSPNGVNFTEPGQVFAYPVPPDKRGDATIGMESVVTMSSVAIVALLLVVGLGWAFFARRTGARKPG